MSDNQDSKEPPDFSVVLGGPLFQLLMHLKLTTPALELLKKRIIIISLFAWLPLLVFSLLEGKAWGRIEVPFLYDIEVQVRYLVALPLLIGAELLVHLRLRQVVGEFVERNIITEKMLPRFRELIDSAMKWRNSVTIELILLILIFIVGNYLWSKVSIVEKAASDGGSWYASTEGSLSLAGYWYFFISRPLFQFIVVRWYFRLLIWARFLWQSSRLELNLIPTHPDRAGGLGFLDLSIGAFTPLILAHGAVLAGLIANSIFLAGDKLTDFATLIIAFVFFLMFIMLGPLLVFSPNLMSLKRAGLREYGIFASRFVTEFDLKWVHDGAAAQEPLVDSEDIQSLADLSNSYQIIRDIKPYPFGKDTVMQLILLTLLPVLPLVLTMIPLNELIQKILEVIFR